MITLIAAALVAAAPAPATADAHSQHQQGQSAHRQMMDCCKHMKADCKDCCRDMDAKGGHGSEHSDHDSK